MRLFHELTNRDRVLPYSLYPRHSKYFHRPPRTKFLLLPTSTMPWKNQQSICFFCLPPPTSMCSHRLPSTSPVFKKSYMRFTRTYLRVWPSASPTVYARRPPTFTWLHLEYSTSIRPPGFPRASMYTCICSHLLPPRPCVSSDVQVFSPPRLPLTLRLAGSQPPTRC